MHAKLLDDKQKQRHGDGGKLQFQVISSVAYRRCWQIIRTTSSP